MAGRKMGEGKVREARVADFSARNFSAFNPCVDSQPRSFGKPWIPILFAEPRITRMTRIGRGKDILQSVVGISCPLAGGTPFVPFATFCKTISRLAFCVLRGFRGAPHSSAECGVRNGAPISELRSPLQSGGGSNMAGRKMGEGRVRSAGCRFFPTIFLPLKQCGGASKGKAESRELTTEMAFAPISAFCFFTNPHSTLGHFPLWTIRGARGNSGPSLWRNHNDTDCFRRLCRAPPPNGKCGSVGGNSNREPREIRKS
jgi:hypothetical protein